MDLVRRKKTGAERGHTFYLFLVSSFISFLCHRLSFFFFFFFTVFSNERIYFGQKPNCPEFAYPWLMESPVFLKLEKPEKELGEKWEDTRTKNMKFVEGATVNSRRKEKMKKESEEKMCVCTWWSVIHGTKAVSEIPLLKIKWKLRKTKLLCLRLSSLRRSSLKICLYSNSISPKAGYKQQNFILHFQPTFTCRVTFWQLSIAVQIGIG